MDSVEDLREALFELNQQRNADLEQLAQSQAILAGLKRISAAETPRDALEALLISVRESTGCDAAVLLEVGENKCERIVSTDLELQNFSGMDPAFITKQTRRLVDLSAVRDFVGPTLSGGRYKAMISTPVQSATGESLVLLCLSSNASTLTNSHKKIAEQLVALATQTLAAKKLTDENALLAEVLNRSSASFSIADAGDPDCALIYVNDAFEALTGYSREEALGQNCRFLSAEDPDSPVRRDIRQTVADRAVGEFEVRNKRKSGEIFWNNLTIFPVEADNRTYVVATQWDLTSRINAEAERDLARQQLISALASVKEGIILLDAEDRVVFANRQYLLFHGLGTEKLARGEAFVTAWQKTLIACGHAPLEAKESALAKLSELKASAGQVEKTLSNGFQVLETNSPTSAGGTVGVLSDVTALKVAQQQLSDRVVAIDNVQDGIAITDIAGRIVYANPGHTKLFGYDNPRQLLGKKWSLLYHTEQMGFIEDTAIPAMLDTGQWRGDVMGQRKDGTPIAHEVTLTQLPDTGLICVTRDVSERLQNEAERLSLREQLNSAQRQEAIGQMAAGLAHDFNNCLSVVSGSAALLKDTEAPAERSVHTQRIIDASEKAAELTGRLLRFGSRNSQRKRLDMREPMQSAYELVKSSVGANIDLKMALPSGSVFCEIDPTDVLQVVMNLVINARDAIGRSAGTIRIDLETVPGSRLVDRDVFGELASDQDYVALYVEDTGGGIAPETLDKIFEAYVTTKSDAGGTGLGLSVVRSLVLANSGGIELSSQLGVGTRFSIYWPLGSAEKPETDQPTPSVSEKDLTGTKAIIVDDDIQVAETIATTLERAGCETIVCEDPNDALMVVEEDPNYWDIVITDYDMPDMTGAILAEKLRMIAENLPIILCTALPVYMGREREGSKLFNARLSKPIVPGTLVSQIWQTLKDQNDENSPG
ncbi:MAG: PAS domain-containing protein [Pseudomonadota bacterium]